MKCKIIIDMDNSAFEYDGELVRIFELLARFVESNGTISRNIYDVNGNRVGEMKFVG